MFSDRVKEIWRELGYFSAAYVIAVVIYFAVMYQLYDQVPSEDLNTLIRQMPSFLKTQKGLLDELHISMLIAHLFLLTAPLMISAFFMSYFLLTTRDHSFFSVLYPAAFILVIPFAIYFGLLNPHAMDGMFPPQPRPVPPPLPDIDIQKQLAFMRAPPWELAIVVIVGITEFYWTFYKIATVGAILFGGYAGRKWHELREARYLGY